MTRRKTSCLLLIAAALAAGCALSISQTVAAPAASSPAPAPAERDATHRWMDRPWTLRAIVLVTPTWAVAKKVAVQSNAKRKPGQPLGWQAIMEPATTIALTTGPSDSLAVVVITFDKQGVVTSPHSHVGALRGRLNALQHIVLSAGDEPLSPQFHLGRWFTGLGDVSTDWAPALCDLAGYPGPLSKTDTGYLYGAKFEAGEFGPTFGCREWAYQLHDGERPYIDVTSYVRVGKVYPKHTIIGDVIGWVRFGDNKPVIGQQDGSWYCLHDCPGGQAPGHIPDIKRWANEQGWRLPLPPTKAPTFPDPPAAPGTYPN